MKTVSILVADDHDIVREGLKTLLQSQPKWKICDEASTGREAVEKARQHKPDIIVLDFSMPELNGLEATRQIRRILPHTEVLILTMHDSEQLAKEVLQAGARGYLLKTHAKKQLVPAVAALAEHQPYFDSKVSSLMLDAFLNPAKAAAESTDRLTSREREIVQLIAEGRTSKEVAATLGLSAKTVEAHRANIMNKLDLRSTPQLVLYAVRNRIVQA
jgi:DNA-binding NarL/FixJ family response regulator